MMQPSAESPLGIASHSSSNINSDIIDDDDRDSNSNSNSNTNSNKNSSNHGEKQRLANTAAAGGAAASSSSSNHANDAKKDDDDDDDDDENAFDEYSGLLGDSAVNTDYAEEVLLQLPRTDDPQKQKTYDALPDIRYIRKLSSDIRQKKFRTASPTPSSLSSIPGHGSSQLAGGGGGGSSGPASAEILDDDDIGDNGDLVQSVFPDNEDGGRADAAAAGAATSAGAKKEAVSPRQALVHRIVVISLILIYIFTITVFSIKPEAEELTPVFAIDNHSPALIYTNPSRTCDILEAHLVFHPPDRETNSILVTVTLEQRNDTTGLWSDVESEDPWCILVNKTDDAYEGGSDSDNPYEVEERGGAEEVAFEHTFHGPDNGNRHLRFRSTSNSSIALPYSFRLIQTPQPGYWEVLYAAIIVVFVYTLIVFEIVHRALAAVIGSFITLMFIAVLKERPTLEVIVQWIDYDTVCLLFGMMVMVSILSMTGAFEFAAVRAYKVSKGNVWILVSLLVWFTAIISAFLDNVTTILLVGPVTIRLCQVVNLDPKPILIAEVLFSNIGGTSTAVGDPPNVIIVGDPTIQSYGIDFTEFTVHMCVGSIMCAIAGYGLLRVYFKSMNISENAGIAQIEREIFIWKRAIADLNPLIREEAAAKAKLEKQIKDLEQLLEQEKIWGYETKMQSIADLETEYAINNMPLFIDCMIVLTVTIILFFIHTIEGIYLSLGWIAIMGAFALILIAGIEDLETLLTKVEWATLLFFAALFVMMEGIDELGLLEFIGDQLSIVIGMVPPEHQLTVSICLIIWVSAITSAFIDNIPFTTAMIPVIIAIAENPDLEVPLRPLVWSLAYGACLGGNGTQIGASANVVATGIAAQYGYTITFNEYFKMGWPMMMLTVLVANLYLLFAHVLFEWNNYG